MIGGVEQKAHYFVLDLPHSDGCFVKAYPAETTEAFLDGHVSALAFLGGVPPEHPVRQYQAGRGQDTGGRPTEAHPGIHRAPVPLPVRRPVRPSWQGQRQGEGGRDGGYVRRNFLVPVPSFEGFEALNAHLERQCLKRMDAQLRGHTEDHRSAHGARPGSFTETTVRAI